MPTLRRSHVLIWLVAAFAAFLALTAPARDLLPVVGLSALGAHTAANLVFSLRARRGRRVSEERPSDDLYQPTTPAALAAALSPEAVGPDVVLAVRVEGPAGGEPTERSPLGGEVCLGYSTRIELYRATALGGDSDFSALIEKDALSGLELAEAGATVRVTGPVILAGEHRRDELLSWKSLDAHPSLRQVVDNEMQVRKLGRGRYTGVRVIQTLIQPGDGVVVWGKARWGSDGVALIRGSGERGSPDAVYVFPRAAPGKPPVPPRSTFRLVFSGALCLASLAAAGVLGRGASWWRFEQAYPWANGERVGTLSWKGPSGGVTIHATTLNLGGTTSWTLDPDDEDVSLVSGEEDAVVKASTPIVVERLRRESFTILPGSPAYPVYSEGRFLLVVPETSPAAQEISRHLGYLQVVNHAGAEVEIRFRTSTRRSKITSQYWTIDPVPLSNRRGIWLSLDGEAFDLTEGDGVLLRRPGAAPRSDVFVALGSHPAAVWDAEGKRWILGIQEATLSSIRGPLVARNPQPYEVVVTVTDAAGEEQGTWTLPAGWGGEAGEALKSGAQELQVSDGMRVAVSPRDLEVIHRGPLASYERAVWEGGVWTIGP